MDLELRHLRVVCTIADTGSVTKAAGKLGLAQPALTAQLNRIEHTLGGPLFVRDHRGARPTPLGEMVLGRARVLLPAMDDLRLEAARLTANGDGLVRYRIGSVNNSMVSGLIRRLSEARPEITVTPQASWSAIELADQVAAGKLDFTIVGVCGDSAPPGDNGLVWRLLAVDAVGVLLPEDHPLAAGEEVDLAELADSHWVATPGDGCFADCFAAACTRAGFTPEPMFETDLRVCLDMVQGGQAIALCQPTLRELTGVRAIPLAGAPLRWRHLLGWHPDFPAAKIADEVYTYARASYLESLRQAPSYGQWLKRHPRFGAAVTS